MPTRELQFAKVSWFPAEELAPSSWPRSALLSRWRTSFPAQFSLASSRHADTRASVFQRTIPPSNNRLESKRETVERQPYLMRAGGRVRHAAANLVKVGGVTTIIGAEWTLGDSHVRPTMRFTVVTDTTLPRRNGSADHSLGRACF